MASDLGAVVPALDKNRYSPQGDLVRFGDATLLEWKLFQLMKVFPAEAIFVSSPSARIAEVARRYQVGFVNRKPGLPIDEMIRATASAIDRSDLLWTNATSPFIGPRHYQELAALYASLDRNVYDSVITAHKQQEYFFFKGRPLNFDARMTQPRGVLEPLYRVTNGCSIVPRALCVDHGKDTGFRPMLFDVDKFAAMEISEINDDVMLHDLLAHYFKKELDISSPDWRVSS